MYTGFLPVPLLSISEAGTIAPPWKFENCKTKSWPTWPGSGDSARCEESLTLVELHTSWSERCAAEWNRTATTRSSHRRSQNYWPLCRQNQSDAGSAGDFCGGR